MPTAPMRSPRSRAALSPKKVVYLWGAGATQAEIAFSGGKQVNLLMQNNAFGEGIATRVMKRLSPKWRRAFESDQAIDIEKLISLLLLSGSKKHEELASKLREYYYEEVCGGLATAGLEGAPTLARQLMVLHNSPQMRRYEHAVGFITTNHDGLLQTTSETVFGTARIGIMTKGAPTGGDLQGDAPLVLQLHGSFTWRFGPPIELVQLDAQAEFQPDTVWIPPTTAKAATTYPFTRLAAHAYELLVSNCDVLRVVGASLTQNDWNVLALIFTAQRHLQLEGKEAFQIELVLPADDCNRILRDASFLKYLRPIYQLSEGDFSGYRETKHDALTPEMQNVLAFWLREKLDHHIAHQHIDAETLGRVRPPPGGGEE